MIKSRICPKTFVSHKKKLNADVIVCEQPYETCEKEERHCMVDLLKEAIDDFGLDAYEMLISDHNQRGSCISGIEMDLLRLRSTERNVIGMDGKITSMSEFLRYEGEIEPIEVNFDVDHFFDFQVRSSEFKKNCPLYNILSIVDKEKLRPRPVDIKESLVGKITHYVALAPSCHHEAFGFMSRQFFTERPVQYTFRINFDELEPEIALKLKDKNYRSVNIRGTGDAWLKAGNTLIIFDKKRRFESFFPEFEFTMQELSYALGYIQMRDNLIIPFADEQAHFENIMLITAKTKRNAKTRERSLPIYQIVGIENIEDATKILHREATRILVTKVDLMDGIDEMQKENRGGLLKRLPFSYGSKRQLMEKFEYMLNVSREKYDENMIRLKQDYIDNIGFMDRQFDESNQKNQIFYNLTKDIESNLRRQGLVSKKIALADDLRKFRRLSKELSEIHTEESTIRKKIDALFGVKNINHYVSEYEERRCMLNVPGYGCNALREQIFAKGSKLSPCFNYESRLCTIVNQLIEKGDDIRKYFIEGIKL